MSTLIKLRRDTAANWAAIDPVLQLGEPGYDTTNNELRIGNGTTAWSGLTPITGGGGGANIGNLSINGTTIGIAGGASETTITMGSNVAAVTVDTNTGAPKINIFAQSTDFQEYTQGGGDYTSAEWVAAGGGGQINITGVQSYFQDFLNNLGGYAQVTIVINGTDTVSYDGWSGGGGSVSLFTATAPVTDPTAVTTIGFNLIFNNGLILDPNEGDMLFRIGDFNLNINSQRDVNITAGDDLRLLGNDITRLAGNGTVTIVSAINTDPNYTWEFNTDGNLTLPGTGAIGNPVNSSLDPLNPNVSTMVLTPDVNYGFQALVLDPTAPGHIHLRAPSGGGNIDQPAANIFLGGEQSSFEVGASYGDAPNVFVRSGGNTWTFDNTGVVTLPNGGVIDNTDNNIELRSGNNVNFEATGVVNVYTDDGNYQWQFGDDGNLTVPANCAIQTPLGSSGNILIHPDNGAGVIIRGGANTLLTLTSDLPDTQNKFEIDTYGANLGSLGGGVFTGTYRRPGSPMLQDDRLASFNGRGSEDGSVLQSAPAAKISIDVAENWSVGSTPTHISFWNTPPNSNISVETTRVSPSGNLVLFSGNVNVNSGYVKSATYTVATLPGVSGTQGARAFVSDADSRTWGNLAVGGAGNAVPVWSDGSNWYIG